MPVSAISPHAVSAPVLFRIVVGVDGTEPGYEACRQAASLLEPDGSIEVFSALYLAGASLAGWSAPRIAAELEREAGESIEEAKRIVGPRATVRLVNGGPAESLLDELRRTRATVVAVGSHGHSRVSEIVIGGVAGQVLHDAPCSVLVARPHGTDRFPAAIVTGVDGSAESLTALAVARSLRDRFGASLRVITAVHDRPDLGRVPPDAELLELTPVDALERASDTADLVVVGSRGLRGVRALGSVSERIAHVAHASVLVVRPPVI